MVCGHCNVGIGYAYHSLINGAISTWSINNQQVIIMDNYDYAIETTYAKNIRGFDTSYDIPEPIDQWTMEDFEQFASLIVDAE